MTQASLWQEQSTKNAYAELCNALYEREIRQLSLASFTQVDAIQRRLQSLPYYINRAAHLMFKASTPLDLDIQNASWSSKQAQKMPLVGQDTKAILTWYQLSQLTLGLVVPVQKNERITLDCIDAIDSKRNRIRTNIGGWFILSPQDIANREVNSGDFKLLKPNKKVMSAACAGHCWQQGRKKRPIVPTLRELLLSCSIDWANFKKIVPLE